MQHAGPLDAGRRGALTVCYLWHRDGTSGTAAARSRPACRPLPNGYRGFCRVHVLAMLWAWRAVDEVFKEGPPGAGTR
jgi:hypothetical protein